MRPAESRQSPARVSCYFQSLRRPLLPLLLFLLPMSDLIRADKCDLIAAPLPCNAIRRRRQHTHISEV